MSRTVPSVAALILLLLASPVAGTSKATNSPLHSANLPLAFEPNRGQVERGVDYVARGNGYSVSLKPSEAVIALHQHAGQEIDVLHVAFSATRRDTTALGTAQLAGHSNYVRGRNPEGWIQDVPQFARVQYPAIYPGIDLVYYGNQGQLEYDFLVSPNADPRRILMRFDGAKKLFIDEEGNLVVQLAGGNLVQKQPLAYQTVHGKPVGVKVRYGILKNNVVELS